MGSPVYQLPWVKEAGRYIGVKEIPGKKHNKVIINFWKIIGRPYRTDEVPWCAGFVSACLERAGIRSPRTESARNFLGWKDGVRLKEPVPGCIVVFWRGSKKGWAGHVGIVTRITKRGSLVVLGGNQDDMVNESLFSTDKVLGYMWPKGYPLPEFGMDIVDGRDYITNRRQA